MANKQELTFIFLRKSENIFLHRHIFIGKVYGKIFFSTLLRFLPYFYLSFKIEFRI